jgi:GNAT superfamily N-acetyltransferase
MKMSCQSIGPDGSVTGVEIRPERADGPGGRALLVAYIADATTRIGEWDETRTPPAGADAMAPPGGAFLIAYLDGRPVGCAGLVRLDERTGEVKRMYVAPAARRRGLARRLLTGLEDSAHAAGYSRVRLDTSAGQPEARSLYEASGYRRIDPYNDNEYAAHWFEKGLG